MNKPVAVSIIIPSFNTKTLLIKCLDSIYHHLKGINFEVIVVDNGSTDGTIKAFEKIKYWNSILIKNPKNLGFGASNNLGAKAATGKWLLFLNSDTKIRNNKLSQYLNQKPNSIYGCQLLNDDGSIQPSTGYFPTLNRIALQMLFIDDLPYIKKFIKSYQQNDINFYNQEHQVDWITGAFMLIPKKVFDLVGGFNPKIFMYGEDVDLCYRIKQQGYKVIFTPDMQVIHSKGGSSDDGFKSSIIGEYKGLITFYRSYYPNRLDFLKLKNYLRLKDYQ